MASERGNARISPVDEVQLLRAAACDWRLSRGDVGVYAVILEHADADLVSYPGPALIARKARLSVTSVKTSIRQLEECRYLTVVRPGLRKRNHFEMEPSPHVPPRSVAETSRQPGLPSAGDGQGGNWSRGVTQSRQQPSHPTGQAQRPPTGQAYLQQLGKRARHEVALEDTLEVTRAVSTRTKAETIPLPTWLSAEAWESWKDHRGKKFSTKAQGLALRKLEALRAEGHDPAKLIDLAIESDWVSFYPRESTKAAGSAVGMVERDPRTDAEIEAANEAELARFNFGAAA